MSGSAAPGSAEPGSAVRGLAWRGIVEGFYGTPWSFDERVRMFAFGAEVGLNAYLYAPKSDPWHRDLWREPYPARECDELAALNRAAGELGVRFTFAISPGLSMRYADYADHRALADKCGQLWDAGIRSFALLFDDVPDSLQDAEDREHFGDGPEGAGRAHGRTSTRFRDGFLAAHGITEPLLLCPTDYAGVARSPYRAGLAAELPADARILWTGADIVVGAVTRDDIVRAVDSYGREVVLWDNFPVNDFDRSRLFLGPLTGRATDVAGSGLLGIAANPMVEAAASRFALATVGEWAKDPSAYDARESARRALSAVAPDAPGLRALVDACSAWPPDAPRWPALDAAIAAGNTGRTEAARLLAALAATDARGASPDLAAQLAPWVASARAAGAAGVLACRVLDGERGPGRDEVRDALADDLLAARRELESHYADVARGAALTLVDDALAALGAAPAAERVASGAEVTILTGENPAPGDRELAEFLGSAGLRCTIRVTLPDDVHPELVVVTTSAREADAVSASRRPIALVAWGHLVALGLATRAAVPLSVSSVEIADAARPAADGLTGAVPVYRGPSKLTWSLPGEEAAVVARDPESAHPAIAHYRPGAMLADGTTAPALRATLFLASDGFAPWLVTPEGRGLVLATVRAALG